MPICEVIYMFPRILFMSKSVLFFLKKDRGVTCQLHEAEMTAPLPNQKG